MKIILIYLPFIISFLIGYCFISLVNQKEKQIPPSFHICFAAGLGMGISGQITFLSFILFNQLIAPFVITLNVLLLLTLLILLFKRSKNINPFKGLNRDHLKALFPFAIILFFSIPLWIHSQFYAFGGWDAWSTWNLKAKFLFLGGEKWQNLFDPLLWRSSPHYPLLLPLINVWGWLFTGHTQFKVPVFTSFLFTILTMNLMFISIRRYTKTNLAVLSTTALLTLPYFVKLSMSQYCDIVLGYFLLASLSCLVIAKEKNLPIYGLLAGLFVGFLSFSKSEGLVAGGIVFILAIPFLILKDPAQMKTLKRFLLGAGLSLLPTIIFQIFYAPPNETVINGLTSQTSPVTWLRFKIILAFYLVESVSYNWNGLWIVLIAGLILSRGKCFRSRLIILPLFIFLYAFVVTFYYWTNTYFKIEWWLQVSLYRIIYAVLPTMVFWVFASLWQEKRNFKDV